MAENNENLLRLELCGLLRAEDVEVDLVVANALGAEDLLQLRRIGRRLGVYIPCHAPDI